MAKYRTTYEVRVVHRIQQAYGRLTIAAGLLDLIKSAPVLSLLNFVPTARTHMLRMIALPPRLVLGGRVAERRSSRA